MAITDAVRKAFEECCKISLEKVHNCNLYALGHYDCNRCDYPHKEIDCTPAVRCVVGQLRERHERLRKEHPERYSGRVRGELDETIDASEAREDILRIIDEMSGRGKLDFDYGPLDAWLNSVEAAEAMYHAAEEAKRDVRQIKGSAVVSREVMDRPFDI